MNEMTLSNKSTLTMTSREIAELVESRHDSVIRCVDRLIERGVIQCPPMANFKNINNVEGKEYLINKRDSYVVVAQLSPVFTAKLVDRWQELEEKNVKQLSPMEMVILSAQAIIKIEQRQDAQDKRMDEIEAKSKAITDQSGYYSVIAYANMHGAKLDLKTAAAFGRKASSESRKLGVSSGSVPDPRFGVVKTYHSDILDIVFGENF